MLMTSRLSSRKRLSQLFDLMDFDSSGRRRQMRHLILEITPTSKRKRRRHGGGRSALAEAMFRMLRSGWEAHRATICREAAVGKDLGSVGVEDQSFLTRRLSMGISQKNKKKKKNVGHAGDKNYCDPDDHGTDVTITRESFLKATVIESNDESTLAGSFPCDHAIHYLHRYKLVSLWLSGGPSPASFHAPVSAKAFLLRLPSSWRTILFACRLSIGMLYRRVGCILPLALFLPWACRCVPRALA